MCSAVDLPRLREEDKIEFSLSFYLKSKLHKWEKVPIIKNGTGIHLISVGVT